MKLQPVLAFALIAAAATASARPEEFDGRVAPGHHERGRPRGEREWIRLGSSTPTKFGTEYFIVGSAAGSFRTLRFDLDQGTVLLRRVQITSSHRVTRTFDVQRALDLFHPTLYVDLDGPRWIEQIVVTVDRFPSGSYSIYGSSSTVNSNRVAAVR